MPSARPPPFGENGDQAEAVQGAEDCGHDGIELWGRRIGRALGLAAVVLMALNLVFHWVN